MTQNFEYEVQCPECGWVGDLSECVILREQYFCPDCSDLYDALSEVEEWEPDEYIE